MQGEDARRIHQKIAQRIAAHAAAFLRHHTQHGSPRSLGIPLAANQVGRRIGQTGIDLTARHKQINVAAPVGLDLAGKQIEVALVVTAGEQAGNRIVATLIPHDLARAVLFAVLARVVLLACQRELVKKHLRQRRAEIRRIAQAILGRKTAVIRCALQPRHHDNTCTLVGQRRVVQIALSDHTHRIAQIHVASGKQAQQTWAIRLDSAVIENDLASRITRNVGDNIATSTEYRSICISQILCIQVQVDNVAPSFYLCGLGKKQGSSNVLHIARLRNNPDWSCITVMHQHSCVRTS